MQAILILITRDIMTTKTTNELFYFRKGSLMKGMKILIFLCCFKVFSFSADSLTLQNITEFQQPHITGIIVDESGDPLVGASIIEKGTTNGVQTDFDGVFL